MAIKYSFVDNAIYGTEDVNAITKDLTGAGVAPFPTQDTYNTSDFNTLTEALVSTGTSLDGCKCTVADVATENMTVTVAQGIVYFESGVRLTVDSEGYTIAVTPSKAGYIFAHYNPALQVADILFDTALPTDGEYVLLAELATNGTITDKRVFARSKVATFGRNVKVTRDFIPKPAELVREEEGNNFRWWYVIAEISDIDLSKFNYAIVGSASAPGGNVLVFDIVNKTGVFGVYRGEHVTVGTNQFSIVENYNLYYYVEIIDSKLCLIAATATKNYVSGATQVELTAEFI